VTTALVTFPGENPRAAWFDPDRWALVYRAADGLVFVRRQPEFAALAARAELPISFVGDRSAEMTAHPLDARPSGSPVRDCEWKRRLGDFFAETGDDPRALAAYRAALAPPGCLEEAASLGARMALGDAALRLRDPATAADAYAGIDRPRAHTNRALALLALVRAQEALDEARAALAADPANADARAAERLARERLPHPAP
jgi:tetratricopeptide (TPR) repeat protein